MDEQADQTTDVEPDPEILIPCIICEGLGCAWCDNTGYEQEETQ